MTSILDINSDCSDSEDDCDYVPPAGAVSESSGEDENEDIEACADKKGKRKGRKKNRKNGKDADDNTEVAAENVEGKTKLSEEDEKKRVESLWSSFLQDVKPAGLKKNKAATNPINSTTENKLNSGSTATDLKPLAKVTVTEVYEFAGEAVTIEKEIDASAASEIVAVSKETESASETVSKPKSISPEKPVASDSSSMSETSALVKNVPLKRPSGLSSVIGKITNKKQKLTTLQKTLYDWKTFKKDEGIEEELSTHNKGRDGFLEKQAFLQRSDLRQFEIEKNLRLKSKR